MLGVEYNKLRILKVASYAILQIKLRLGDCTVTHDNGTGGIVSVEEVAEYHRYVFQGTCLDHRLGALCNFFRKLKNRSNR